MSESLGKKFESKFFQDWKKSFPGTFIYRLHDQMTGYKITSQNPCDFLAFNNKTLWMLECKETKENTFNFAKLTQYENLLSYAEYEDIKCYVIIWFSQHDKVIAAPVKSIKQLKEEGFKSINIKSLDLLLYNIIEIPSVKKRVFLDSDYSCLTKFEDRD